MHAKTSFGAVVIGRNEGERLKACLASVPRAGRIVYVDSGSADGSPEWARSWGADVVELDMAVPFTAARARNAGFKRLRELAPNVAYVQFVDGDCELLNGWLETAVRFLDAHAEVAAVNGRLRESQPDRSVYNWLCDREWDGPAGEVQYTGGIVMLRAQALEQAGGFREDLIAGEEPELCVRLRGLGWRIWRLDQPMAIHDVDIKRFSQWWRRTQRGGYAFAQGARLHGAAPDRHWVWESRRAWLWGLHLPIACATAGLVFGPPGWASFGIYPLQVLRQAYRNVGSPSERATLALFQVLARFPEVLGQIAFHRDDWLGRQGRLIEYKSPALPQNARPGPTR